MQELHNLWHVLWHFSSLSYFPWLAFQILMLNIFPVILSRILVQIITECYYLINQWKTLDWLNLQNLAHVFIVLVVLTIKFLILNLSQKRFNFSLISLIHQIIFRLSHRNVLLFMLISYTSMIFFVRFRPKDLLKRFISLEDSLKSINLGMPVVINDAILDLDSTSWVDTNRDLKNYCW